MGKTGKPSVPETLEGKYRIVSAVLDFRLDKCLVVLTLYSGSTGLVVSAIPHRLLAIAQTIAKAMIGSGSNNILLPLFNQVLEIVCEGQFTVPVIREPDEEEIEEINATP